MGLAKRSRRSETIATVLGRRSQGRELMGVATPRMIEAAGRHVQTAAEFVRTRSSETTSLVLQYFQSAWSERCFRALRDRRCQIGFRSCSSGSAYPVESAQQERQRGFHLGARTGRAVARSSLVLGTAGADPSRRIDLLELRTRAAAPSADSDSAVVTGNSHQGADPRRLAWSLRSTGRGIIGFWLARGSVCQVEMKICAEGPAV